MAWWWFLGPVATLTKNNGHARTTTKSPLQEWCKAHFSDFITSAEWPPFSPDLNPIDYSIWSILEAMSYAKPHKTLEALKQSLIAAGVGLIVGGTNGGALS